MKRSNFIFSDYVDEYVASLLSLMEYANAKKGGRWANQSDSSPAHDGVYGSAQRTLRYIIREELKGHLPPKMIPVAVDNIMSEMVSTFPVDEFDLTEIIDDVIEQIHDNASVADSPV